MTSNLIYQASLEIFSKSPRTEPVKKSEKLIQIMLHQYLFLQHLRILWYHNLTLDNFSNLKDFWLILSYPSFDVLLAQQGFLSYFYIFSLIVVGLQSLAFITSLILVKHRKAIPRLMKGLIKFCFFITVKLFFIPMTLVMMLGVKYSTGNKKFIEEYDNDLDSRYVNFGLVGIIVGVILLIFHLGLSILYENVTYEICHVQSKVELNSKITSLYDALYLVTVFKFCMLYVLLAKNSYIWYLFLVFFGNMALALKNLYYFPYYDFLMNLVKILLYSQTCMISIFFIAGINMKNGTLIFVFFFFLQPVLIYIIYKICEYRLTRINTSSRENMFIYELSLREDLKSGSKKESLLKELNKSYNSSPNKLNLVLQAYYSKDHLNSVMLGLIKISRTNYEGLDIFSNFQVFKCRDILQSIANHTADSFKLYQFSIKLQRTKTEDYLFCMQMLKLLEKIQEDNIELTELKEIVLKTYDSSKKLKEKYQDLIKIFPESNTALELYGTLLTDIINDGELGRSYFNKRTDFLKQDQSQKRKQSFNVQENSCILIASGNSSDLGRIIYANANFLNFIEINEETLKESYLWQFVPHPFDQNHDLKLELFIKNSTNHHVFRSSPLFLNSFKGFLVECYFNSDCIGCDGEINFLSVIEPITKKEREAAIISKSGQVLSHSENFPKVLRSKQAYVEGSNIRDFFSLSEEDIKPNFFCIENNVALIVKEKIIGSTQFLTVYVTSNFNTMQKWKNKGKNFKLEFKEKKLTDINFQFEGEEEKTTKKFQETGKILDFENKKKLVTSESSNRHKGVSPKLLKSTVRGLSIMKYLLLSSLVTILVYNAIILIYISQAVSKVNSLDTLILIGDIAYTLSHMTLVSRGLHLKYYSNISSLIHEPEDLQQLITQLSGYKEKLLNEMDSWSFCQSTNLFTDESIIVWEKSKVPSFEKKSLHFVLDRLEDQAQKFLEKLLKGEDCKDELFFIVFAGIGQPFKTTKESLRLMKNCDMNRVVYLDQIKNYLMIVAISISAGLAGILTAYLLRNDRVLNQMWNFFRNRAGLSQNDFKRLINDRLIYFHDQKSHEEDCVRCNKTLRFWHSFGYFKRFFIIFLLTALIYVVTSFVFYDNIHKALYNRPEFMAYVILRRILISEYSLFTCEMKVFYTPLSIRAFYPEFTLQENPFEEFFKTTKDFSTAKSFLRKSEIMSLMSNSLKTQVFERIPNVSPFLSLGTYTGYNFVYQESLNHLNPDISDPDSIGVYLKKIFELCSVLQKLSSTCNNDSKSLIESELRNFIYFVSSFSLSITLLFFLYYTPFINKEIKTIKILTKIIEFFPERSSGLSSGTTKQPD